MDKKLEDYANQKAMSTIDARDFLHIGTPEPGHYDLNYAGNTFNLAVYELNQLRAKFATLTAERDRMAEAAQEASKELRRKLKDGETVYNILYSAQEILTAALDKDAKG